MTTTNINLNDVYLRAHYYDIVFDRDISDQIDFCQQLFHQYTGQPIQTMLEVACGPAYHSRAFARRGIRAFGMDLSGTMVSYAQDRANAEGLDAYFFEADMSNFTLETPVDFAICVFDASDFLLSPEAVIAHAHAMKAALRPGGLYLIEQIHPKNAHAYKIDHHEWTAERDGVTVTFVWGKNTPKPDVATALYEIEMEMHVYENGEHYTYYDRSRERSLTPQEFRMAAEDIVGGLKIVDYYGDFRLDQPLDWSEGATRMITVVQKV